MLPLQTREQRHIRTSGHRNGVLRSLAGVLVVLLASSSSAQNTKQDHVIYLIGDAGAVGEDHSAPVLRLLREVVAADASKDKHVLFLGDNIYPGGLHKKGDDQRASDEACLGAQVEAMRGLDAQAIFIPGNHDWEEGGRRGWKFIQRQADYVTDTLPNAQFLPKGGCPGPEVVELGKHAVLVIIDTQWWLHAYRRGEGERDGCSVLDEDAFLVALNATLYDNRDKRIVIAAHHPLRSQGNHGGHFSLRDHVFPLTNLNRALYIPLPVVGSIYPMYRGLFGHPQDMAHERYASLRKGIEGVLRQYPGVVYAAGHEHILQYLREGGVHHVISGTGSGSGYIKRSKRLDYGRSERGFARLTIGADGFMQLDMFTIGKGTTPDKTITIAVPEPKPAAPDRPKPPLAATKEVVPNAKLKAGAIKRAFLGGLNRDVWTAPITVPVIDLDTAYGKLQAKSMGGGKQTRSLRLKGADGHDYVMRSIKKYPALALEPAMRGTLVERIVDDGIAGSQPYAGVVMPGLSDAVKVYHTNPRLVYLPDHPQLGQFRDEFGESLCLLEERTDGDWSGTALFGGSSKLASSGELIRARREGHDDVLDERALVRARLFDMLIGDWDRHDDQWRWATFKDGERTIYKPVPRDRDQAFFRSNGAIPSLANRKWAMNKFQNYGPRVRDVSGQMYNARYLDRAYLVGLDRAAWRSIADSMRTELTDAVIERSIRQFPDTTYALVGDRIIHGLKGRRDRLLDLADEHYMALAKHVNVVGTDDNEFFDVTRLPDGSTRVELYARKNGHKVGKKLYYSRTFQKGETKEIRLYGLDGRDEYHVSGDARRAIKLRIIGGLEKDVIQDSSHVRGWCKRTIVYESGSLSKGNKLRLGREAKLIRSKRSDALDYDRLGYKRDVLRPLVALGMNPDDGFFLGGGFLYTAQAFNTEPFKWQHRFIGSLAFMTGAYRVGYSGRVNRAIGATNMGLDALVLAPNFNFNFFGYGNRTEQLDDEDAFKYRVDLINVEPYLSWTLGHMHEFRATAIYRSASQGKLSPVLDEHPELVPLPNSDYLGARASYALLNVDNPMDPGRGIRFNAEVDRIDEMSQDREVYGGAADIRFYIPARIFKGRTVFALRAFVGRSNGEIDPILARHLGGLAGMRGLRRTRFSGNSVAGANFELRQDVWVSRNNLVPFRLGLIGFADAGRVWLDGLNDPEEHFWHTSVGGGFYISPLNMITLQTTYGVSDDDAIIDIRLGYFF